MNPGVIVVIAVCAAAALICLVMHHREISAQHQPLPQARLPVPDPEYWQEAELQSAMRWYDAYCSRQELQAKTAIRDIARSFLDS